MSCIPSSFGVNTTECEVPCWKSIIPGKSTKAETLLYLKEVDGIDLRSITEAINPDESQEAEIWFRFKWFVDDSSGSIKILNDTVSTIYLITENHISLTNLVEMFGEPEYVIGSVIWGDGPWLYYFIVFPKAGVAAVNGRSLANPEDFIEIKASNDFDNFYYFSPTDYPKIFINGTADAYDPNELGKFTQTWRGYGSYQFPQKDFSK